MNDSYSVLLIDDDENFLKGLSRQFRNRYTLLTFSDPQKALDYVSRNKNVGVAVVDMRMPGMDGLTVLAHMANLSPTTFRIMLTGNADQQTTIDAINNGEVFRFFSKPCQPGKLAEAIDDALVRYRQFIAEKRILEQTVAGSVKLLLDVLSFLNPEGFGKTQRIRIWAKLVSDHLKLSKPWILDIAATLIEIDQIFIPDTIQTKLISGAALSQSEKNVVEAASTQARELITNIPRLEDVAEAIFLRNKGFDGSGRPQSGPKGLAIPLESRILRILSDLENVAIGDTPSAEDFAHLSSHPHLYDEQLFLDIQNFFRSRGDSDSQKRKKITINSIHNLISGDELLSNLSTEDNQLVLSSGHFITEMQIRKIKLISQLKKFSMPISICRKYIS